MSMFKSKIIICPKCNNENKVVVWKSITVDENLEIKEQIKNEKLFEIKCEKCGEYFDLEYNFLYHDATNEFMVWYFPWGKYNLKAEEKKLNEKIKIKLYDNLRIVDSKIALKEKIYIFEDNLNDIVIEIIKRVILEKMEESNVRIFYLEKKNGLLYFSLSNNISATFPYSSYIKILNDYKIEKTKDFTIIDDSTFFNYVSEK